MHDANFMNLPVSVLGEPDRTGVKSYAVSSENSKQLSEYILYLKTVWP